MIVMMGFSCFLPTLHTYWQRCQVQERLELFGTPAVHQWLKGLQHQLHQRTIGGAELSSHSKCAAATAGVHSVVLWAEDALFSIAWMLESV